MAALKARRAKGEGSIVERNLWAYSLSYRDGRGAIKRLRLYANTRAALARKVDERIASDPRLQPYSELGSISHSSKWQFSIDVGVRDGKRQRRCIYADSRVALMRKVADERARGGGTLRTRTRTTVEGVVGAWLTKEKRPNVAPSTYEVYRNAWELHVKPLIGDARFDTFNADDVQAAYDEFRRKKVGGRTIEVIAKIMRAAYDSAIRKSKYFGPNPWRTQAVPTHKAKIARILTADEARRFVKAARSDSYEALWLVLLFGGLRLGEGLGLRWRDIDLENGELRIEVQATQVGGAVTIGDLKTPASRRRIIVSGSPLEALRRRRAAVEAAGNESPFVFTSPAGALLDRSNVRRRHFGPICTAAEIEGLSPHGLRHTMASHAVDLGLPLVAVQRRLGHASSRMTLQVYSHALEGQQREAAAHLESRLDPFAEPPAEK